jgi:hypothetical protein
LKFTSVAVGAAVGVTAFGLDEILKHSKEPKFGLDETLKPFKEPQSEPLSEILCEIKSKYGIYIPGTSGEYIKNEVEKSAQITLDEAKIIESALKIMPSPGKFTQLIIPFRNESADAIAGGNYWGPNWDFFLDYSKYKNYPRDRYLSKISALNLVLPDKKPGEPMPPVTPDSNFLPLFSAASMNEVGIQPKNIVNYPWTTHGERLKQVIIHEIGSDGVIQSAGSIKVNYNPEADYQSSAMSLFGGIPLDTNNPIMSSFAKVNGWRLIPYSDFMAQWGDVGKQYAEDLKRTDPKMAAWPVWDRDPEYWGSLENRTIRLDTYASYGTIKETLSQFSMFYTLSRVDNRYDKSLLTDGETKYFNRMFNGLSGNPEKYIRDLIAQNPGPSFNLNLFETPTSFRMFNQKMGLKYPHELPLL